MKTVVQCIDCSRARKCPHALQVLHGQHVYCTEYKETGPKSSVVRNCEH